MLPNSSSHELDPVLEQLVKGWPEAEGRMLAKIRLFSVPVVRIMVGLSLVHYRPLTLVDEFILQAAAEIRPAVTVQELAEILAVDERWIRGTLREMNGLVEETPGLVATSLGRECFNARRYAEPVFSQTRVLVRMPPSREWKDESDLLTLTPALPDGRRLRLCEVDMLMELEGLSLEEIRQALERSTHFDYQPARGYEIKKIEAKWLVPPASDSLWIFYSFDQEGDEQPTVHARCLTVDLPVLQGKELAAWLAGQGLNPGGLFS